MGGNKEVKAEISTDGSGKTSIQRQDIPQKFKRIINDKDKVHTFQNEQIAEVHVMIIRSGHTSPQMYHVIVEDGSLPFPSHVFLASAAIKQLYGIDVNKEGV